VTLLLLLVPLSVLLLGAAIAAFAWAVRSGQFDDLDTPPLDILRDEDAPRVDAAPRAADATEVPVRAKAEPGGAGAHAAAAHAAEARAETRP